MTIRTAFTFVVAILSFWEVSGQTYPPVPNGALRAAIAEASNNGWVHKTYGPIGAWDVSQVTDFTKAFWADYDTFNEDISAWDVSQGTSFESMFSLANAFNQPIGDWDVSKGTNFYGMFQADRAFNQPIGNWDVGSGTDFSNMFIYAYAFNQPIGGWDVSKGRRFEKMFYYAKVFNQPIGDWDVSKGTEFGSMFFKAYAFNQNLCPWNDHLQQRDYLRKFTSGTSCPSTTRPAWRNGMFASLCQSCATASPTASPTTKSPTASPTHLPTSAPTKNPTKSPTTSPTENPTNSPTPNEEKTKGGLSPSSPKSSKKGSGSGDPHFKTWSGEKYDYHGECDLVLVNNPSFADGLGLRVHIRTTRVKYFSFIEKVALQIGPSDVLEFDNDVDTFLINGEKVEANREHHKTMFSGFLVRRDPKAISVRLSDGTGLHNKTGAAKIDFHTRKNGFPAVIVDGGHSNLFEGSLGLLGDWKTGRRLARDGKTEMNDEDATAFALEWQVRDTEPMLFKEVRLPQFPTKCIPPAKMPPTRLGSNRIQKEAEEACAHWLVDREDCIFDVLATRDVLVAQEGHIVHIE